MISDLIINEDSIEIKGKTNIKGGTYITPAIAGFGDTLTVIGTTKIESVEGVAALSVTGPTNIKPIANGNQKILNITGIVDIKSESMFDPGLTPIDSALNISTEIVAGRDVEYATTSYKGNKIKSTHDFNLTSEKKLEIGGEEVKIKSKSIKMEGEVKGNAFFEKIIPSSLLVKITEEGLSRPTNKPFVEITPESIKMNIERKKIRPDDHSIGPKYIVFDLIEEIIKLRQDIEKLKSS